MKVISKVTEIYKIKSSLNIFKIDLVLKILSSRFQIYKKFQKWTFRLTDINHSKYEDEIKYMSIVWRERTHAAVYVMRECTYALFSAPLPLCYVKADIV